ncbi:MAG: hypothetical protein ACYTE6_02190, partial [Planctomycetota bacterium]
MPGKRGDRARRGLSRFDVVAVIVVIAILLALALALHRGMSQARSRYPWSRDATQLKQIHAALATFSSDYKYDAGYPLPSR